jgi:hypothetical protein
MAKIAVKLLLNQIKTGKETNTNYYIEPFLRIRGSTSTINIIPNNVISKKSIEMHDILYKISD